MPDAQTPRVLLIRRFNSKPGPETGPEIVAANLPMELERVAPGLCIACQPREWRKILMVAGRPSIKIIHYVTSGRVDFLAPLFRYVFGKTIVMTFHGIVPARPGLSTRQALDHRMNAGMARSALRCAQFIISVSEILKNTIALGYPGAHHTVIHNGLSRVFAEWNLIPRQGDDCLKLLMVGFAPTKGLDFVLQTLHTFTEQNPESRWTLTIASVHPRATTLLQELLSGYPHLGASIRIVDRVPHDQMPAVYAGHDAVLICSAYESFGLVVLESMSMGVPPVVSDRVGAGFVVQDGSTGFVVEFGNVKQLVSVLGRLSVGVSTLDRKAMRHAALELSWGKAAEQYVKLYMDILGHESPVHQSR